MQAFHHTVGYVCSAVVDQHWEQRLLKDLCDLENQANTAVEEEKSTLYARLHEIKKDAFAQFKEQCVTKWGPKWGAKIYARATDPKLPAMWQVAVRCYYIQRLLIPNLPSEIWQHIFSFLPGADLQNTLQVSRCFYAIICAQPEYKFVLEHRLKNHVDNKKIAIYPGSEVLNCSYHRYNILDFHESYCDSEYHQKRQDLRHIFFKRKYDRTGLEQPLIFAPIPPNPKGYYLPVVREQDNYYGIWVRVSFFFIQFTHLNVEKPNRCDCDDAESIQIKLELEQYILENYQMNRE